MAGLACPPKQLAKAGPGHPSPKFDAVPGEPQHFTQSHQGTKTVIGGAFSVRQRTRFAWSSSSLLLGAFVSKC
jgi:hypothetical protein